MSVKQKGREVELLANGSSEALLAKLRSMRAEDIRCEALSLEEIFVASDLLTKTSA